MLARRFTIICLLATIFAFGLISLIQKTSRPAYSWRVEHSLPCILENNGHCGVPLQQAN